MSAKLLKIAVEKDENSSSIEKTNQKDFRPKKKSP